MSEPMTLPGDPVLSCAQARALEDRLFGGDESREWAAMGRAGVAVATAVLDDLGEIGGSARQRVLVLAGKGHNGGDAVLAAEEILGKLPDATADLVFALGQREMRPLAVRALRQLVHRAGDRVRVVTQPGSNYDICLDGIFGFQFRPPVPAAVGRLLETVERAPIRLRAAVDLPSGLEDSGKAGPVFRADFTYATGSVKLPVLDERNAVSVGRVRYLDLGFFAAGPDGWGRAPRILGDGILEPLRRLRPATSDKRTFGNLFIVAGSDSYPGAALLCALGALRSGAGLVTAFVPERFAPAFAARAPGAIWVPCTMNARGGHSDSTLALIEERLSRATALAVGPGIGDAPPTLETIAQIVKRSKLPMVLDADALRPAIVRSGSAPRILTPHAGELSRIGGARLPAGTVLVQKGRITRLNAGKSEYLSLHGGPVLARGGSGDILTGIIGGLIAQRPKRPLLESAAMSVAWHGRAADALSRECGAIAVETTDILSFMRAALEPRS